MSLLEFLIASLFEYVSIFALTFQMFSFRMKEYAFEITIISIILGFVAYSLKLYYNLALISPIIIIILYIFFLWLMLRIHIYNAIIMASVSVLFGILQLILLRFLQYVGIFGASISMDDAVLLTYLTGAITFLISFILWRFDLRYTFISNDTKFKFKHRKLNIYIVLLVIFLQLAVMWFSYYFILSGMDSFYMVLALVAAGLILSNFYFLNQEERHL